MLVLAILLVLALVLVPEVEVEPEPVPVVVLSAKALASDTSMSSILSLFCKNKRERGDSQLVRLTTRIVCLCNLTISYPSVALQLCPAHLWISNRRISRTVRYITYLLTHKKHSTLNTAKRAKPNLSKRKTKHARTHARTQGEREREKKNAVRLHPPVANPHLCRHSTSAYSWPASVR